MGVLTKRPIELLVWPNNIPLCYSVCTFKQPQRRDIDLYPESALQFFVIEIVQIDVAKIAKFNLCGSKRQRSSPTFDNFF